MIALNHAVAVAMVHGLRAGLDRLEAGDRISGHFRLAATRAHLLERSGAHAAAKALYHVAAGQATSRPERDYLALRAARIDAG